MRPKKTACGTVGRWENLSLAMPHAQSNDRGGQAPALRTEKSPLSP